MIVNHTCAIHHHLSVSGMLLVVSTCSTVFLQLHKLWVKMRLLYCVLLF